MLLQIQKTSFQLSASYQVIAIRVIFSVFENFIFSVALWKSKVLCYC